MRNYEKQIQWLLEGDPSIVFQTLRDLCKVNSKEIKAKRGLILEEGWGKKLMEHQDSDGMWGNGLYSPKWISTFYTLLLLKRMGAKKNKGIEKACKLIFDKGLYKDGGINYWKSWKQGETCVTGMLLSILSHFKVKDERLENCIEYLIKEQMPDKGWNCESYRGAKHSSFHTTISVLEGLWEYEKRNPDSRYIEEIMKKQQEGVEFLLEHDLYKSSTTGKIFDSKMIKLSFPSYWHYDIIRCLDYLQDSKKRKDERMSDAIFLLKEKRTKEGFWKLEHRYTGKVFFTLEKQGKESRWNTLRALRVLKWWDNMDYWKEALPG